ncbi:MAG: hypothetical protein QOK81_03285 [Nitrososphaeraceae archaeon]|nr:hypothetical protein [Nitrososphaeraceae archaeon]
MVRIAKRLVRYNMLEEDSTYSNRRMQYACEKCAKKFGAWKHLRQHKVESHSY